MSLEQNLFHSQQLHRTGTDRIEEVSNFLEELQSRSLRDRRQRDRSLWNTTSTRIHQLGDI